MEPAEADNRLRVEIFKLKRIIKKLDESKGNGTSMISFFIPPKKQLADCRKTLSEECGKAANIKDRVNRQSVQTAITSALERLKLYNKTPNNGLIIYCGNILEADGRTEKKLLLDFEPFRPINYSAYLCDNRFHTEQLKSLLDTDPPFGFIIVDGQGALYATLQGNSREILHKFNTELPKKHNKGGQSSVRFARLRVEKRHNYLKKVCEIATQVFILNDKATVSGLVLAGSADFKNDLNNSQMFDPRLAVKVVKIVDVSYGGENGLNQAIELSQECLKSVKFVQEKKLISRFFEEIAMDTGKFVYGVHDTMKSLEAGALETIMCFEGLEYQRVIMKNKDTEALTTTYLKPEQFNDHRFFVDPETKAELEVVESFLLTEWLAENYKTFGAELEFLTDKSAEGFQFVKGFSGMGGFLRYKMEIDHLGGDTNQDNQDDDDFI